MCSLGYLIFRFQFLYLTSGYLTSDLSGLSAAGVLAKEEHYLFRGGLRNSDARDVFHELVVDKEE